VQINVITRVGINFLIKQVSFIGFERDVTYWDKRHTHMAFPPYWFFSSTGGNAILKNRIKPDHSVGVHVPVSISKIPNLRPVELRSHDLFTEPGESRQIPVTVSSGIEQIVEK
jgi:hypothetical protein